MKQVITNDFSRLFSIEGSAGPENPPVYQGYWRPGGISEDQGDITRIYVPSRTQRGRFDVVGKYRGAPGNPSLEIMARYTLDRSDLLRVSRKGCDVDLQVHFGQCSNPQDYTDGWEKIVVLENALPTTYGTDELGALSPDEVNAPSETVPFEGERLYEILPLTFQKTAGTEIALPIKGLYVCDAVQCGLCGVVSDGCQVVVGVAQSSGTGSPGLLHEVIYTRNGGNTWGDVDITTLANASTPTGITCVGPNVVVITNIGLGIHWANLNNLVTNESHTWTAVTTGFVASKGPNAIWSATPTATFIVGDGGYIYFSSDPTSGVSVQSAGAVSVQNLNAVHGLNEQFVVAVGASNTVLVTRNGGSTWESVTGPAVGVVLNTVWVKSKTQWFIGTAGGKLFYTKDGGTTWTEKTFSGSGAGSVTNIAFVTNSVGYMTHNTAAPVGRIFRTINGGYSWKLMPELARSFPSVAGLTTIAVCVDPNVVFAGGTDTGGTDGVILKGA